MQRAPYHPPVVSSWPISTGTEIWTRFATSGAAPGQRLYTNDAGRFTDATARASVAARQGGAAAAVAGDYDNDNDPDLLLLRQGGVQLLRLGSGGVFEDVTDAAGIRGSPAAAVSAAFVDVDHDGDLDIFIAGGAVAPPGEPRPAPNQLLRNNGNGTFQDTTRDAGLLDGALRGIAVAPTDFDNRRDIDLLVIGSSGPPRLFKNMRDGTFADAASEAGLPQAAAYSALAAADVDKDGYTDFLLGRADATGIFVQSDGQGRFRQSDRDRRGRRGHGGTVHRLRQRWAAGSDHGRAPHRTAVEKSREPLVRRDAKLRVRRARRRVARGRRSPVVR